jgi:hypothetical protein
MDHASTYRIARGEDGGLQVIQTFPNGHEAVFRGLQNEAAAETWLRGRLGVDDTADLAKWLLREPQSPPDC